MVPRDEKCVTKHAGNNCFVQRAPQMDPRNAGTHIEPVENNVTFSNSDPKVTPGMQIEVGI